MIGRDFLLDKIPNHRVMPFGALRKLDQADVNRSQQGVHSGLPSIDKVTWSDLWYETTTRKNNVFVYEGGGEILGYVSFLIKNSNLFLDAIAIDKKVQGKGLGGCLMRWAESCARTANCTTIQLWAKNDRIEFYVKKADFKETSEKLDLGSEKYTLMERKLLYNLAPRETN